MEATTTQIITLILITLSVLCLSAIAYYFAIKKDKIWFYVYCMMVIVLVQWMSDTGAYLLYQGYYLHLASVILFPSIIFSLIIIYVLHGKKNAIQLFHLLIAGIVGYFLSIGALYLLGVTPNYLHLDQIFIKNHFFSSFAIVVDYLVLIYLWPLIYNPKSKRLLFLKVWLICWILLTIDTCIFTLGTFWPNSFFFDVLSANIVIRSILSVFLAPILTIYLQHELNKQQLGLDQTWKNPELDELDKLQLLEKELQANNLDLVNQRKAILNVLDDVQGEKLIIKKQADTLKRFETASAQSTEMIVFTDSEGIVEWANQATETITGFTVKEATGKKAGVLWGNLMDKDWYESLWQTIKTDKKLFSKEIKNHRKNGQQFIANLTIYPLLNSDGTVQIFVATQRDITHEKDIDRMKTDFISLASHQLRTPLSAMKWFLEMLMAGDMGELNKEQRDAIDNIDQSNERMIALVNGLLNISRIESGRIIIEPTLTDLAKLTTDAVHELDESFKNKKQVVKLDFTKDIISIFIDSKLIRQVITNLLTNANKYTKKGGEITISILYKDNDVVMQITDNGYGIPAAEQDKIFARFFRATNVMRQETDGTGLGLYLAKAIVESSGGKIWFKSTEGQGTTFWFTIPLDGMKPQAGEVRLN